jgi:arylsulfatase A-like enzyme
LCLIVLAVWTAAAGTANAERPNVVLILIDDLSHYGVTAYGADRLSEWSGLFTNQTFSTPNIDGLAKTGVRCDHAYAYPLCEPTRIALMSGQYNSRNFLNCKSQHASDITFGDVFQKAGYATGIFGKWKQTRGTKEISGKDYIFEFGWDEFCCFDVVDAGQRFINPNLVVNGEVHNYKGRTDRDPATGRRWYGPDICNRQALEFIDRHADEPFFLYYPMLLVHAEHKPTPDTQPCSVFDDFDEDIKRGDDRRFFLDMLAYMDKQVGKVVDKLDELGLRDNTVVIVMGDNGTKEPFTHVLPDGEGYPGGKGGNRDNGLHVPLVLSCPGRIPTAQAGTIRTYDGLIDVTDIYPTICEAAGIAIPNPAAVDGISFWPQMLGAAGEPRTAIYTWYNGNNPATDSSRLLRYAFDKVFKRYAPHASYPQGRFFDLRTDPLEMAGDRAVKVGWVHYHHSGLELDALDAEQKAAYEALGQVIEAHRYLPVARLKLSSVDSPLAVGDRLALRHSVVPAQATRQNVIWQSSDPAVATVDKFGVLTAHAPGSVEIAVYSWDDANPSSANTRETFSHAGIRDAIRVKVVSDGPP